MLKLMILYLPSLDSLVSSENTSPQTTTSPSSGIQSLIGFGFPLIIVPNKGFALVIEIGRSSYVFSFGFFCIGVFETATGFAIGAAV